MKRKREGLLQTKGSQLRLLDLPADILTNIISRLQIRDAIKTSVLSSRCRYLWCDHANLAFDFNTLTTSGHGKPIDLPGFLAKVDAVLEQHSGIGVNVLYVYCDSLRNTHADHIDRWVKFAVESRTKELSLHLSDGYSQVTRAQAYDFPCHFFSGSYLRCLRLTSVSLNLWPPSDNIINGFLNLRELSMADVSITGEHLEYLLSKCNLLEFLEVVFCITLTSIRALHPNRLKHLVVHGCAFLKRIEMNCGLSTLEYSGPVVPLQFATISRLRNVRIDFHRRSNILDYITTGFPSTLPHLETFSLGCSEHKMAIFPVRPIKFMYLRHLRLEVTISDKNRRKTDVLNYAYLLNAAPFLEQLELHMWMKSYHRPYVSENYGELRSLTLLHSHKHTHLKSVYFTGFFGYKDQVELALHILHTSAVLQSMKIDPEVKLMYAPYLVPEIYKTHHYIDGRMAATEFVRKVDRNNVVQVVGASPTQELMTSPTDPSEVPRLG